MRPSKALIGVFATAVVLLPLVAVSPAYADKPDDLSSDTTPITDQASPEIGGSSIEEREATPNREIPEEIVGDPLPTREDVWAPAEEADDIAVPSDSNAPEQAWTPLPSDRLVPAGKQGTANRAPVGTTAGAPGLGGLPWFAFQDLNLSTDASAQVNLANRNLLLKANDLVVRVPGYGLRDDRFYNGLSTVAGSLGGGWQNTNAEKDLAITATLYTSDWRAGNWPGPKATSQGTTSNLPRSPPWGDKRVSRLRRNPATRTSPTATASGSSTIFDDLDSVPRDPTFRGEPSASASASTMTGGSTRTASFVHPRRHPGGVRAKSRGCTRRHLRSWTSWPFTASARCCLLSTSRSRFGTSGEGSTASWPLSSTT